MKDEYKKVTMEWLGKADSDLGFAKASFEEFDEFYSQMCVLCHDAVEKYLKAYIVSNGVKPERTHDLAQAPTLEATALSSFRIGYENRDEKGADYFVKKSETHTLTVWARLFGRKNEPIFCRIP